MKRPHLKAIANDDDLKPILKELASEIGERVVIRKDFEGVGDLIWKYSNTAFQWINRQDTRTAEFDDELKSIGRTHNSHMKFVTEHLLDDRREDHLSTARIKTLFTRTAAISSWLAEIRERESESAPLGYPSRYRRHKPSKSTKAIYFAHTRSIKIIELLDSFSPKLWLRIDRIIDLIDGDFERLSSFDDQIHDFNILELQCIENLMRVGIDTHKARQEEFDYETDKYNKRNSSKYDLEKIDYTSRFDDILRKCNEFIVINTEGRPTAPQELDDGKPLLAAAEAKEVGEMFERARGDMSRRAAAKEAGIDHKNLGKIENGETDPSLKTMRKIADGIGYDVEVRLVPKDNG